MFAQQFSPSSSLTQKWIGAFFAVCLFAFLGSLPIRVHAASPASITSPVPGSTFSGSTVGFSWSAGGATQYWLQIGTVSGGTDIFNQSLGIQRSANVAGLPVDGRTIYVRLWAVVAGNWVYNDYRYIAYTSPAATAAIMIAPQNGTTLTSSSVAFTWTNTGAQEYYLYVGKSPASSDIYAASQGTATSRSISNLPTDGSRIYVRLWSRFGVSQWLYSDYFYTAYRALVPVASTMVSPQNGSTLQSRSATFSWTNTGAQEYYLYVGRALGGSDFYGISQSLATSRTISNLPADGSRIFVRLGSRFGANWLWNDYNYLALRGPYPSTGITTATSTSYFATKPVNMFASEYVGQCTWYVFGRVLELVENGYLPAALKGTMNIAFDRVAHAGERNANQWPARLGGHWIPTSASSSLPVDRRKPGLIAVYPGPPSAGHVGFVEEVSADKKRYRLSEFNRLGTSKFSSNWYYFDKADVPAGSAIDADGSLGSSSTTTRFYPAFYDPSDSLW